MVRFLQVLVLFLLVNPASAADRPELLTTSPQGVVFKLSEPFNYPATLDQLDDVAARMQTSINPRTRFQDMRYMRETEGRLNWHFAWYQVANEPIVWPVGQVVTAVFRNGQQLTSAEILFVTQDEQRRPIKVSGRSAIYDPDDLRRPSNKRDAILVFVGFPADFRLRDSQGRQTGWSLGDVASIRVGPEEQSSALVR